MSSGPGKFDAELVLDGKAFRPYGKRAATLIPLLLDWPRSISLPGKDGAASRTGRKSSMRHLSRPAPLFQAGVEHAYSGRGLHGRFYAHRSPDKHYRTSPVVRTGP